MTEITKKQQKSLKGAPGDKRTIRLTWTSKERITEQKGETIRLLQATRYSPMCR